MEEREKTFSEWLAEAEGGNVDAMLTAGVYYIFGEGVVEPDFSKAEIWLKKAGELGCADAFLALGIAYDDEELGHCDKEAAWHCFKHAAGLGNVDAIFRTGQALLTGTGVPADPAEGMKLLRKAADLGSADAHEALHRAWHHGPDCGCGNC